MAVGISASKRILSIDILRGIVMLTMALDHTRFFFSDFKYDPTNLQYAGSAMFLTRWVTNFCAPVFVLLSGTSAFLSLAKTGSKKKAAFKLFTRGIWLIILEITIVRFGWSFDLNHHEIYLQVIWAIGCSMVVLSLLIFLPIPVILAFGLLLIFGHNAFDNIHPSASGSINILWHFLHVPGPVTYGNGKTIFILYPLIPWIGVMAVGYCMGVLYKHEDKRRKRWLLIAGAISVTLFIALRAANTYGDPAPWQMEPLLLRSVLSFINCTKYPPSLFFLLMTIGPSLILLSLLEKMKGNVLNIMLVYGRVPLFFYLLHIFLIHGMALAAGRVIHNNVTAGHFSYSGYSLPIVYVFWLIVVSLLYIPCRWFMKLKMSHKNGG